MGTPSSSTVQAPQPEVSQPTWVPVSPSSSRRKCTSSSLGSTSALRSAPLTVTVIRMRLRTSLVVGGDGRGVPQAALGEGPDDVALVVDRTAQVGAWRGRLGGQLASPAERLVVGRGAAQGVLGGGGGQVGRPDRGEADAGLGDAAVLAEGEPHRHGGGGEVADLALQLEVAAAGALAARHPPWSGSARAGASTARRPGAAPAARSAASRSPRRACRDRAAD